MSASRSMQSRVRAGSVNAGDPFAHTGLRDAASRTPWRDRHGARLTGPLEVRRRETTPRTRQSFFRPRSLQWHHDGRGPVTQWSRGRRTRTHRAGRQRDAYESVHAAAPVNQGRVTVCVVPLMSQVTVPPLLMVTVPGENVMPGVVTVTASELPLATTVTVPVMPPWILQW